MHRKHWSCHICLCLLATLVVLPYLQQTKSVTAPLPGLKVPPHSDKVGFRPELNKLLNLAKFANLHRREIQNPTCSDVKTQKPKVFQFLILSQAETQQPPW